MASLSNHADGRRTIYASLPGRPKICLGRIPKKQAEGILRHVEVLTAAKLDGSAPPDRTSQWVADLDPKLRNRLADLGLCAPLNRPAQFTLQDGSDTVKRQKHKWSENTRLNFDKAMNKAAERFGWNRDLLTMTRGEVKDYAAWLVDEDGKAESTAGLYLKSLSWCFDAAIDRELTERNPVNGVEKTNAVGKKAFVDTETCRTIAKALPQNTRIVFALARWGGLRTISEHRHLSWTGIDWERRRMTFWSPKTKSHRTVPILDELLPHLEEAWDLADVEAEPLVCPRARVTNGSLTGTLKRTLEKLGIDRWPRLWHSLRSSCETELLLELEPHVVAKFIGHTVQVQQRCYATVTDADYDRALLIGKSAPSSAPCGEGAESGAESARNGLKPAATATSVNCE